MTILFAYDGSAGADEAITTAAKLLGGEGRQAVVLSVWEPLVVEALHATVWGGPLSVPLSAAEIDERSEELAGRLAERGVAIATEAGFDARGLASADTHNIAECIVSHGDKLDVDLIVLGARGLSGIRALLGSVSHRVLQHAHRPVLVVPPTSAGSAIGAGADAAAAHEAA